MDSAGRWKPEDERAMLFPAMPAGVPEDGEIVPDRRQPRPARPSPWRRGLLIPGTTHPGRGIARRSLLLRGRLRDALREEADRGTAFLFIPVGLAAGAGVYFALPREPAFTVLIVLCLALALAVFLLGRGGGMRAMICASTLTLALGAAFAKFETWRAGTPMLGSAITSVVTGRVVRVEHRADGRHRLTIDVLGTARPTLRYAPRRIRVTARALPPQTLPGAVISGAMRLFPPRGPVLPGGYDFAFESYMAGIGATGFAMGDLEPAADVARPSAAQAAAARVEAMRLALAERITARIGGAEGAIAAALIAGVRAGIPEPVNEALRRTGLAHVLSISGLHMALVAGTVIFALRAMLALAPGLASRRPVRKYAAAAGLAAASYYLVVSGAAVAAQRSFIMIAVMLVALLFDRAALTMRNLAIAGTIVIALAPHEVVGPSFQMSFAATAALIAFYSAWSERRMRRAEGMVERPLPVRVARGVAFHAAGLAATSLVAGLATALYGVWHFHRMAPLGLLANLAAMPVVSAVIMPSAVAAGALMPFGFDGPALDLMGWGIGVMLSVSGWLSDRTPFDAVGAIPGSAVLLLTAALVLLALPATWLRLTAVPFLAAGLLLLAVRSPPDVLVSEDARLVAIPGKAGLAVNRARPNGFVAGIWQGAVARGEIIVPGEPDGAARSGASWPLPADGRFLCEDNLCVARTRSGAVISSAADEAGARRLCGLAGLIVIDDATARNPCAGDATLVLTKRDLARRGAAEVRFPPQAAGSAAGLRFSVREPFRPWHAHRRFSREARGLPPYRRD